MNMKISRTFPSDELCSGLRPYHVLQFWTVATYFQLAESDLSEKRNDMDISNADIVAEDGSRCGSVFLHMQYFPLSTLEDFSLFEFLVLSKNPPIEISGHESPSPPYPSLQESFHAYQLSPNNAYAPHFYHVMLIMWDDDRIAERRGLGRLHQHALQNSTPPGPVWKQIVLG